MKENELLKLAGRFGFEAAVLPASEVPTDGKLRPFCEENRCGMDFRWDTKKLSVYSMIVL